MTVEQELEDVNLFEKEKPLTETPLTDAITDDAFEIPEKFIGKSTEDVIKSYQNLEQDHGRKSNEIGELRKLTDEILQQQVASGKPEITEQRNEVGFDDLIEDPHAAIEKVLSANPRLAALEQNIQTTARANAHSAVLEKHGDADTIVTSPEFQNWLAENHGRQRMFAEASNNLDSGMANSILDMYKSSANMSTKEAVELRDTKAKEGLKRATNEKGNRHSSRKPVYKRAELIQMKVNEPDRWLAMGDDIREAYADGRVR